MSRSPQAGFTLVEVMVALAIVALSLPALLFTLDQQLEGTRYLRERSLAQFVAANRLSELRLGMARDGSLTAGRSNGEWELAQQIWYWSSDIQETQIPGFFRAEVRVAAEPVEDAPTLTTLTAYLVPENARVEQ